MGKENNTSLIPISTAALVRVGKSIEITNKIIKEHERRTTSEIIGTVKEGNEAHTIKLSKEILETNLKDYTGAIEDYTKAIEKDLKHPLAYNRRGIAKEKNGDYTGAIEDYTKAIYIDPEYANAYNNRGNAKYWLKNYTGAIEDYTKAIDIDPEYADAYFNRGIAKEKNGDYTGAIDDKSIHEKLQNKN